MSKAWPLVQLGEVLVERREQPSSNDLDSGRVKVVEKISFNTGRLQLRVDGNTKTGMILVRPGDLVVSGINAAKGAIAIYDDSSSEPVAATIHYGAYAHNRDRVDIRFLWWMLRSHFFREVLLEYVPGGIKTELKSKRFLPIPVPLPPLAEQRRVVARIEELAGQIGEARALRSEAAEAVEVTVQSSISSVIGHGWSTVTLAQAVDPERPITYGIVQAGDHIPDGVPYIRVSDMAKPRLTPIGMLRTSKQIADRYRRSAVREGDIVFAIRATIGKMRFVPKELEGANLTQGTARIAPSKIALATYLYWALQSRDAANSIQSATKGSTFKEITLGKLREVQVPLPAVAAQRRIVAELDALNAEVDVLKRQQADTATELDALLPAILDRAFKGELV